MNLLIFTFRFNVIYGKRGIDTFFYRGGMNQQS